MLERKIAITKITVIKNKNSGGSIIFNEFSIGLKNSDSIIFSGLVSAPIKGKKDPMLIISATEERMIKKISQKI